MNRSLSILRLILVAALAQLAMFYAPVSVGGASITLSDPNCDSFSISGPAGAQVLGCVISNAPTCVVSGPGTAQINTNATLTATCTSSPTSYSWSGGTCSGGQTSQTCTTTSASIGLTTYTVTATNGVGGGSASKGVTWTDQPVITAPTGCTLTPSASTVAAGTQVTLTANCSGGGAATSWLWS